MKLRDRLTIRARITLGSLLIALVILAVALAGARAEVSSIFRESNTSLALSDLNAYSAEIIKNPRGLIDDSGMGILISVQDPLGRVELDTLPRAITEGVEHRPSASETFTWQADGTTYVVVSRLVKTSIGTWTLRAARSEAASELALQRLDLVFLLGALFLLGAFGIASWLLAAAALRPVVHLRRKAEGLSVDSLETLPVGATHDEVSELAETLNSFIERVRASTSREKQVVSDAAHELRTPLSALKIQLELAHEEFHDAKALAGQVIAAEESVARLSALATNLLELSRLETRQIMRSSSFEQLVTELMGSIDRARMIGLVKNAEISFTVDLVRADQKFCIGSQDFARLLDNLLANAVAAVSDFGHVQVVLSGTGAGCVIRVSDNGPGMSEHFLPRAFDRFSRPDDSRTARTGGSGLGLALVKAIAVSCGGTVTLANGNAAVLSNRELANSGEVFDGLTITVEFPRSAG